MPGQSRGAGDFDAGLFEAISRVGEVLSQVQSVMTKIPGLGADRAGGRSTGARHEHGHAKGSGPGRSSGPQDGGPWSGGFGRQEGQWQWQWPGGFGGPRGHGWPGASGPGSARGPKASRGDVRAAILALLREGPRTGYQIMSEIEERSAGAWRPSPGAVYPALSQLADEGLIIGVESGGRRTFSLTDAGRQYVEDNPGMARGAWESMAQQAGCEVPALFAHAARLGGGIVQVARAGTPEQVHAAEQLLDETRRALYRILADDAGADSNPSTDNASAANASAASNPSAASDPDSGNDADSGSDAGAASEASTSREGHHSNEQDER